MMRSDVVINGLRLRRDEPFLPLFIFFTHEPAHRHGFALRRAMTPLSLAAAVSGLGAPSGPVIARSGATKQSISPRAMRWMILLPPQSRKEESTHHRAARRGQIGSPVRAQEGARAHSRLAIGPSFAAVDPCLSAEGAGNAGRQRAPIGPATLNRVCCVEKIGEIRFLEERPAGMSFGEFARDPHVARAVRVVPDACVFACS
ncbi:hypothetical protein ACVIHD_005227 [Bradyrhizobium embrapense]